MQLRERSFGAGVIVALFLTVLLLFFIPGQTVGQATGVKESEITSIRFTNNYNGGKVNIGTPHETVVTDRAKIAEFYKKFVQGYAMTPDNVPEHHLSGPDDYTIQLVLNHNQKDYVLITVSNLVMVGRYKRQDPSLDYVGQTDSEKEFWKAQNYQPGEMSQYIRDLNTYITTVDSGWVPLAA